MDELVEQIAAKENDVPIGELERQQRRRVHVSSSQTHLPLLDEVSAIEYDREANRIEAGPAFQRTRTVYRYARDDADPQSDLLRAAARGLRLSGVLGLLGVIEVLSLSMLAFGMSLLVLIVALIQTFY